VPKAHTPKPRPNPKAATEIDALIGAKIRRYRLEAGMSQTELGQASAITFQQVQKYERGANRVSVARLAQLAATLGVPLVKFMEDLPVSDNAQLRQGPPLADQLLGTAHGLRLVKGFLTIDDEGIREQLVALVLAIARGGAADEIH
jgi:transcriptional regulator with XRE-family HTH domain